MRVFTVHLRRHGLDPDRDVKLVKEGFSWPAFLFTFLWALWNRMWWTALGPFVIVSVAGLVAEALVPDAAWAAMLVLYAAVGFLGNDLYRRYLGGQGFVEVSPVCGKDRDEALYRFLDADPALARDLAGAGLRV